MKILALPKMLASRPRKKPITTIVLHATAGSTLGGALSTLRLKGFSYHYLIDKDGTVTKGVPYGRVAFHAGESMGPDGPNVNEYSIGISFVNRNDGKDPYTAAQTVSCENLIKELCNAVPLHWLTTHYAISGFRGKTDPKRFPCSLVKGDLMMWGCK